MLSLRGCILWTPPCSGWPSPARWGCPCPALRAAPPMPSCAGTWPLETTFTTCPISATCMPTAPSSSTPSLPPPITALSTTMSTSALLRTRQARFEAPAFTSKQVRPGHNGGKRVVDRQFTLKRFVCRQTFILKYKAGVNNTGSYNNALLFCIKLPHLSNSMSPGWNINFLLKILSPVCDYSGDISRVFQTLKNSFQRHLRNHTLLLSTAH